MGGMVGIGLRLLLRIEPNPRPWGADGGRGERDLHYR